MDKEKRMSMDIGDKIDWDEFFRDDEEWEKEKELRRKKRGWFVKLMGSILALSLLISGLQIWFDLFNIPALRFLQVSQQLSSLPEVKEYKQAVVTIETGGKKGTGFNTNRNGIIITNEHVVEGSPYVIVYFKEHGSFIGNIIAKNETLDLAIVKIEGENLPHLPISQDEDIRRWNKEKIIFIGNPLSYTQIANQGEIIDYLPLNDGGSEVLIIDAPVYRGNSGSPVINENGEVIGVIYATLTSDRYGERVGLATPAYYIWELMEQIK